MGVSARDNSPGFHQFWGHKAATRYQFDSYWGNPDEWFSQWEAEYPEHTCSRSNKVNNPIRMLSDAGPVWRDPSPYDRHIVDVTATAGRWRKEYHGLNYMGKPYTQIDETYDIFRENLFSWNFSESRYSLAGGGPSFPTNEENHALDKALQKLKDRRVGMGENLAQAASTFRQLGTEAWNLVYALRAVKRGNFGLALKHIGDRRGLARRGADMYLQYRYGWKPIVEDIYSLSGLLREQCQPALLMYAVGGMPRKTISPLSEGNFERDGSIKMTGHVRLTGKINNSVSSLPDKLGLSNPLSLGWDLIPFSFVVDWVTPVGGVLDGMTAPLGLDFVGGYASARFEGEFSSTLRPDYWSGFEELSPRINTYRVFDLMRKTYSTWPKVGLYVKSPFSYSHGATSLALFIQKLFR